MIRKTKEIFVAKDGKEFDTEREALAHEAKLDNTIYVVAYLNRDDWEISIAGVYKDRDAAYAFTAENDDYDVYPEVIQ